MSQTATPEHTLEPTPEPDEIVAPPELPSPWAPHAVLDVLAVLALSGLTLSGLWPMYDGWRWALVAAAGVVLGVGWALMLIRWRLGMDLVLETLFVPYLLTAGAVALGVGGPWWLPDRDTLGQVLEGSVLSWIRLSETAPPVDSRGVVLLLPYAIGLLGAGATAAIALRSRKAAVPLVPLLVMLLAVQVLGRHDPLRVLIPALAFGAAAVAWVAHRGNRADEGSTSANPAALRFSPARMLVRTLVVAVAVAAVLPLVPRTQFADRWLVREAVPAYDSEAVPTPLSHFRRFRPGSPSSLAGHTLLQVDGVEPGTPIRIAVLDVYDGTTWLASSDRGLDDEFDRFLRVPSDMDNPGRGRETSVTIRMQELWDMHWLPVVGRLQAIHFFGEHESTYRERLRYNRSTMTALLPGGIHDQGRYVLETLVGSDVLRPTMKPWPERDEELWKAASFLDSAVTEWSEGAATPMEALFQIATTLRERGYYSDGHEGWETQFTAGHDKARLGEGFITGDSQVGNDEQYAAAMALLANRLGIPARVVVGTHLARNGLVRGEQFDAWIEVRIADGSWRSLPVSRFMSQRRPEAEQQLVRQDPDKTRRSKQRRPQVEEQEERQEEQRQQTEEKEAEEEEKERRRRRWWLLLLLVFGVPPTAKAVRRRRRRTARLVSHRFTGAWDELLDRARDLGFKVGPATRGHQAMLLSLPPDVARRADVAAFGEHPPAEGEGSSYWVEVGALAADLRSRVPWWRRILAVLSPMSLIPRQR